jgi:hypothetical protein
MTLKKIKINEHFQKKIYYEYIYIYINYKNYLNIYEKSMIK